MIITLTVFLIACLASAVSGFFGSGSGLVSVPLLSHLLYFTNIPPQYNMHVVIGTLFPFGFVITVIATIIRHKQNIIDWNIFRRLLLPTIFGVICGSLCAHYINNFGLRIFFGLFILTVAIQNVVNLKYPNTKFWKISSFHFEIVGFLAAFSSGVTSMGILMVLYLRKYGISLLSSIAIAQTIGIVTAIFGTVAYIILGLNIKELPASCLGYVNWQFLIPMVAGGLLFTKFGARLSYQISTKLLNQLFCGFLFIVALEMLFTH